MIEMTAAEDGTPLYFSLEGQIWLVDAEPVRWFERVSWWATKIRMSVRDPGSRIDVEVWRLQCSRAEGGDEDPVTFEVVRDGPEWSVRSRLEAPPRPEPLA